MTCCSEHAKLGTATTTTNRHHVDHRYSIFLTGDPISGRVSLFGLGSFAYLQHNIYNKTIKRQLCTLDKHKFNIE